MAEDWDLQAVVRGCTTTSCSSSTTTTTTICSSSPSSYAVDFSPTSFCISEPVQEGNFYTLQDLLFEGRSSSIAGQLQDDLFSSKPLFLKSSLSLSPQNIPISPLSVLGGLQDLSQQQHQQQQKLQPNKLHQREPNKLHQQRFQPNKSIGDLRNRGSNVTSSHNLNPKSKRRKTQLRRICQVHAEALSSDMWSWRKYGQKPIKGSPYPRGYYRCSTSKGCLARKQVERNRSDPGMFIVTYTAEHNHPMPTHRNSLAGSTRQKPVTPQDVASNDLNRPFSPPPLSPGASLSPAADKLGIESSKEEIMEDEYDDFNHLEMALDDGFFDGLEELTGNSSKDCFSDHFPATSMQLPWLNSTTAAGGC